MIGVCVLLNRRNSRVGLWLNLCVTGWAGPRRGPARLRRRRARLIPHTIFIVGAVATATTQRMLVGTQPIGRK